MGSMMRMRMEPPKPATRGWPVWAILLAALAVIGGCALALGYW